MGGHYTVIHSFIFIVSSQSEDSLKGIMIGKSSFIGPNLKISIYCKITSPDLQHMQRVLIATICTYFKVSSSHLHTGSKVNILIHIFYLSCLICPLKETLHSFIC